MASQTLQACYNAEETNSSEEKRKRIDQLKRAQWLRAAILGANDGLLSTTSLMLGVGAAKEDRWTMILAGLAGAFAGSCSMAVGEFVSVSTQRDIEKTATTTTDRVAVERGEHSGGPHDNTSPTSIVIVKSRPFAETKVVTTTSPIIATDIKVVSSPVALTPPPGLKLGPGMSPGRSPFMKVITEDHATSKVISTKKEEEEVLPNPYIAAAASALSFLFGSLVPLVSATFFVSHTVRIVIIVITTSIALALFGAIGAHLGSSPVRVSTMRVLVGGWISMAITYGLLKPFDRDDHH